MVETAKHDAALVVANYRRWGPEPKLGALHVYVDGRPRRVVGANQERPVLLSPGKHSVRVRHWWFMSPPRTLELNPGSEVRLQADVAQEGTVWRRIVRSAFRPLHSLSLRQEDE